MFVAFNESRLARIRIHNKTTTFKQVTKYPKGAHVDRLLKKRQKVKSIANKLIGIAGEVIYKYAINPLILYGAAIWVYRYRDRRIQSH